MPWFKLWAIEWLGMTAGLSSDAIALAVQVCAQSWAAGRDGQLVERLDSVARLAGLDPTRCRRAIDDLSTRDLVIVNWSEGVDGPVRLRIPYLEKQAARRQQQSESANRRRFDKESTPQAQKLRSSEDERSREKEKLTSAVEGAATVSGGAPPPLGPKAQRQEEASLSLSSNAQPSQSTQSEADVLAVFSHFRSYHPDDFRTPQRDSKEWSLIEARLREGRTVDELKLAIDGCHADPWHRGENEWKTPHLDLSLIFRDASKTSALIAIARAQKFSENVGDDDEAADRLCADKGWPKWRRACEGRGIPTHAALSAWLELKKDASGRRITELGKEHLDEFARRYFETYGRPKIGDGSDSPS